MNQLDWIYIAVYWCLLCLYGCMAYMIYLALLE